MNKTERQQISIKKAVDANFNGILNLCVRFGKTRIGLALYKQALELGLKPLILVPSATIKNGWILEDQKSFNIQPIIVTVSQLLSVNKSFNIDLLIVDELHKFVSEERYNLINKNIIRYSRFIGLTGTLPIGNNLTKLTKLIPIVDHISEAEAIKNNWVSQFVEYNIPLELSDDDKYVYSKLTDVIAEQLQTFDKLHNYVTFEGRLLFNSSMDLLYGCSRGANIKGAHISSETIANTLIEVMRQGKPDEFWNIVNLKEYGSNFSKKIDHRNNIIIANSIKLKAVLHIYETLNVPTLCFNESIHFSDTLSETLNSKYGNISMSYHSKTESKPLIDPDTNDYYRYKGGAKAGQPQIFSKVKQLEYAIAAIDAGFMKVISTVKALDEGITIPNIECLITTSGTFNPIQYEQRTGRAKTYTSDDKVAKIYNLYFDDFEYNDKKYKSRDKTKLIGRQINSSNVKNISLLDV
jgi:superfamily II DNA or RNA helicase